MKKVQEGDFSVSDVVVDSRNEIGSLTKSFDVMTHRIQELMEQNVHEQEAEAKKRAESTYSLRSTHISFTTRWIRSSGWQKERKTKKLS